MGATTKANQSAGGGTVKQKSAEPMIVNDATAELAGCSHDLVYKVKKILREADSSDIDLLRSGKVKINAIYKKLQKKEMALQSPHDSQEKKVMAWINDITNKMLKFDKVKDEIPEELRDQVKGKIIPLITQIFGS
jgi:hypothetical protein